MAVFFVSLVCTFLLIYVIGNFVRMLVFGIIILKFCVLYCLRMLFIFDSKLISISFRSRSVKVVVALRSLVSNILTFFRNWVINCSVLFLLLSLVLFVAFYVVR